MELGAKLKLAGARRTAVPELWLLREATNGRIDPRKGLQHPTPSRSPEVGDHCCPADGFYEWREEGGASTLLFQPQGRRAAYRRHMAGAEYKGDKRIAFAIRVALWLDPE